MSNYEITLPDGTTVAAPNVDETVEMAEEMQAEDVQLTLDWDSVFDELLETPEEFERRYP